MIRQATVGDVVTIRPGYNHVCSRLRDGTVGCQAESLGDGGAITPSYTPFVSPMGASEITPALRPKVGERGDVLRLPACRTTLKDVVNLDVASFGSCAVLTSGRVACWGRFDQGGSPLGLGREGFSQLPFFLGRYTDAIQVGVGVDHGCAVRKTGGVACFGRNLTGQLGDGTRIDRLDAVEVRSGHGFSCARRRNGRVHCWGRNDFGQVGTGPR